MADETTESPLGTYVPGLGLIPDLELLRRNQGEQGFEGEHPTEVPPKGSPTFDPRALGDSKTDGASAPALDLAFQILDVTYDKWQSEWRRADLARELVDSVSPEECRRLCRDVLETSHRNVLRWAEKAREWPKEDRSPEYAYRSHDVVMRRARESLKEAEVNDARS